MKAVPAALARVLLLFAAASTLLLFLIRFHAALSLGGILPSSGVEGSGALGIFRVCQGAPLYHDFSHDTNIFVFNFLFYELYGHVAALFGNCVHTVPLVGRILTVALLLLTAVLLIVSPVTGSSWLEKTALATAVLSPYVGWWAFALRPDVGGMFFLTACLLLLLRHFSSGRLTDAAASALCLILAWAFKQTFIMAAPIALAFVARKNPRAGMLYGAVLALGLAVPFLLYSPEFYLDHTVRIVAGEAMLMRISVANTISFLVKASPVLVVAAGCILVEWRRPKDGLPLSMLIVFTFLVTMTAAAKIGAADNYFFPTYAAAVLLVLVSVPSWPSNRRALALAVYSLLAIALNAAVLMGAGGTLDLNSTDTKNALIASAAINRLPNPKLVWDSIAALPWYTDDVATRIPIEQDGFQRFGPFDPRRLIMQGYYSSLALPAYAVKTLDVSSYRVTGRFGDLILFRRKD